MSELSQTCPFPDCAQSFVLPEAAHGTAVCCPGCGRSLTALDPMALRAREAERLRRELAARALSAGVADHALSGGDPEFVALFENIRSLWNVGSMFRSADGAGLGHLTLAGITGTPPRPEISKTALGAETVVPWSYQASPEDAALDLKARGFRLIALETGKGSVPVGQVPALGRIALIVGHEVAGISGRLLDLADVRAALPMRGVKESLNVAVAFGVASYALSAAREAARAAQEASSSGDVPEGAVAPPLAQGGAPSDISRVLRSVP